MHPAHSPAALPPHPALQERQQRSRTTPATPKYRSVAARGPASARPPRCTSGSSPSSPRRTPPSAPRPPSPAPHDGSLVVFSSSRPPIISVRDNTPRTAGFHPRPRCSMLDPRVSSMSAGRPIANPGGTGERWRTRRTWNRPRPPVRPSPPQAYARNVESTPAARQPRTRPINCARDVRELDLGVPRNALAEEPGVPVGEADAAVGGGVADGLGSAGPVDAVVGLGERHPDDPDGVVRSGGQHGVVLAGIDAGEDLGLVVPGRVEGDGLDAVLALGRGRVVGAEGGGEVVEDVAAWSSAWR
jgi:hypothetical protein